MPCAMLGVVLTACSSVVDESSLIADRSGVEAAQTEFDACECYAAMISAEGVISVDFAVGVEESDTCPEVSFVQLQLTCTDVPAESTDVDLDGDGKADVEFHGEANPEPNTHQCGVKFEGAALAAITPPAGVTVEAVLVKAGGEICSLAAPGSTPPTPVQ
jgi:hypothetical protein